MRLALSDPRLWAFVLLQHSSVLATTFQYFYPSIVETLNYPHVQTLLLTVPPWMLAFFASLFITWNSGRTGDRGLHIVGLMCVSLVGNIIAVSTTKPGVRYFAMFLMPLGVLPAYSLILAWLANSFPRPLSKRSASIATANAIANLASVYGSYMWPSTDAPRYIPGGAANSVVLVWVMCVVFGIRMWHRKINARLAEAEAAGDVVLTPTTATAEGQAGVKEDVVTKPLYKGDHDAKPVGFRYPF